DVYKRQAYVCRSFTCSPPQTEVEDALSWVERLAPDTDADPESTPTDDSPR
ncbi:hypothetical protein C450_00640, partial [Halococcus salifodinae DSM 8989]